MPSSYQVVLWKQESFVVLRPLQIEFFRNLLGQRLGGFVADGTPNFICDLTWVSVMLCDMSKSDHLW
jgi:hypothetical protein